MKLHKGLRKLVSETYKSVQKMPTVARGQKVGIEYCDQCKFPNVYRKPTEDDKVETWCLHCDEKVETHVLLKKDYMRLLKQMRLKYLGA